MDIQQFKKQQKDYEVIESSLEINRLNNWDNSYTSLSDALYPYLSKEERGDLDKALTKIEELSHQVIEDILKNSKKLYNGR